MAASPTLPQNALAQTRLLLVDDEGGFRQTLRQGLENLGLSLVAVGSCREAIAHLECEAVDVVIMDMQMPETDGIECLRRVKGRWPEAEVILLTGHASVQSGIAGMEAGAFDYCIKPIDLPDLLEKLELAAEKALINREDGS